jgi:hypothetical protein
MDFSVELLIIPLPRSAPRSSQLETLLVPVE